MDKIVTFGREAKDKLKSGIEKLNKAVSVTHGPYGRNVLIQGEYGDVKSTKDGVTVAKSISVKDPIENMAISVLKNAAIKTLESAGDGTTTSIVLAHSIAEQAMEITNFASVNITHLKRGIEAASKEVINELKKISKDITSEEQIKQVAKLSSNGDEEIANLVKHAIDKVGREGIITVEESKTGETSLEVVEGMQFDRGYKSPFFVTDNNSMQCVLTDALILIFEKKINQAKDILPILENVSQQNKSLLIIAEDIDGEALATLIVNKMRGTLKVAAVKAPDFGERRTLIMEDIATLTGGTLISPDKGMRLEKMNIGWFGQARTITIGKETTTIVDGVGKAENISTRVVELKSQIDKSASPFEIEKLQERLGKLLGGVAIINVGGGNEIEIKEKKDRIDDALQATKAALDEGVVPGAGVALMFARRAIKYHRKDSEDFNKGKTILWKACIQPFEQILKNAGESKVKWILKIRSLNQVPSIEQQKTINPYDNGIIDPTKVVRLALANAVSAAVSLLMTECVIGNEPSEKKEQPNFDI